MLAFAKNITQDPPHHPQECNDSELKQYMEYQRKLNPKRIVSYALDHAEKLLKQHTKKFRDHPEMMDSYLEDVFPLAHGFADLATIKLMVSELIRAHKSTTLWYQLNSFYAALTFDCMKEFLKFYNGLVVDSPVKAEIYYISEGELIDFDDWSNLYFPNLDFHIGKPLDATRYPFSQRNKAIEEAMDLEIAAGNTFEEALKHQKVEFGIDDCSIKLLLHLKLNDQDLEMPHLPAGNSIYDYLTQKQEGTWESIEGESILDQAYSMGAQFKVWAWKKRKRTKGRF